MANLTQLGMLEGIDGLLLVDKPVGITFSTVVKTIKRKFNLVKVGHGGSLDAMASGLFVLLLNDANKFVGDIMGADRAYEGRMRLGLKTDTHDVHGNTVATAEPSFTEERLQAAIRECKGDIFQTEPRFCTIRKEGTAAYEVVDTGEHFQFLSHVYRFQTGVVDGASMPFAVTGTKSLLVRTLINDFGDVLGCGACLESLRRTTIGKFSVTEAIPFDKLLETEMKDFASCVMPLSKVLL